MRKEEQQERKEKIDLSMAGFLEGLADNLLGKIIEAASQSETRPIKNELRELEFTVSNLKLVLTDAEEKQANEPGLSDLLQQLKNAFSEAVDLIDELECEYLKWRVGNRRNGCEKVTGFYSSSNFAVHAFKYVEKINSIREKLGNVEKAMSRFHLAEEDNECVRILKSEMTLRTSITGPQVFSRLLRLKKEMILSDNHDSIVCREDAKKSIIDKLLVHGDSEEQFSVLLIHGVGGMGKTTLAKLVYNDDKVFNHFDKRIWVCVSEDFDVQKMRRDILSCATGELVTDALTEKQLQIRLQRNLIGRKFLLVLDDAGTLNSRRELEELREILKMGADGSKIVVTTCIEPTLNATVADPRLVHKIERLCDKQSMDLFEFAFKDKYLTGPDPHHVHPPLLTQNICKVAEEFVPKCDGVPLAIKCLAGLLFTEINDPEWMNVKDMSEIWKRVEMKDISGVLPALKLSYDLMPSYLKPCFLCFSFLPKDYVFYSYELIQLWMAQGILHSGNKNLELVGEQYFDELWSRGLIEDVEEHALGYWFKIHSLVHDFAIQLAQEQENQGSLLHLSFMESSSNKDLPSSTSDKIRSLTVSGVVEPKTNGVPLFKCISKFKQLRFLYLCNSSLEELPTSIDTLKHLRYFDLRGNRKIKRLPESICNLQSLQTLILAFCSELEELPKNIKSLISLRLLWITTKQACLGKDGIGSLISLRFLAIGGCENLTQLFEDIDRLNSLQTLIIYDCKSLLSLPEGLKTLTGLSNMAIWGCQQLKSTSSLSTLHFKRLILKGISSLALLPPWILLSETLELLEIGDFPKLGAIIGKMNYDYYFPELRILRISNCPKVVNVSRDMLDGEVLSELWITLCGSIDKKVLTELCNQKKIPTKVYVDSRRVEVSKMGTEEVGKLEGS